MSRCREYVEKLEAMADNKGLAMPSIRLLSAFGRQWSHRSSKSVEKMKSGQCYRNAFNLVLTDPENLAYCEGFAMAYGLIPLEHAWVVDKEGRVIDPTWSDGFDYFGVAFDFFWLLDFMVESGHYGVFGMLYTLREIDCFSFLRSGLSQRFHAQSIAQVHNDNLQANARG